MITFDCPHCGNPFKVQEKHAGRDGWCRICKRLVIVPHPDGSGPKWEDLSLDDRVERLDAKLQYAAAQADHYKLLMARYCERLTRIVTNERIRIHHVDEKTLHSCLRVVKHELVRLRKKTKDSDSGVQAGAEFLTPLDEPAGRERDDLKAALEEAERIIEELRGELAAANDSLSNTESEHENLSSELDALREALKKAEHAGRDTTGLRQELAEVQSRLEKAEQGQKDLRTQRQVLIEEVESIRTELDAATHARDDAEGRSGELARELAETRDALTAAGDARAEAESLYKRTEAELESMRTELAAVKESRHEAMTLAETRARELDAAKAELDRTLEALRGAENREQTLAAELKDLRTEIAAIAEDKEGAESLREEQAQQLAAIKLELDKTAKAREEMESLRAQHARQIEQLEGELFEARKTGDDLRDEHRRELETLQGELDEMVRARDEALADSDRQAEKLDGLIDRFGASAQEAEEAHGKAVESLHEKLAMAEERNLALSKELATLRADLADAHAEQERGTLQDETVDAVAKKDAEIQAIERERDALEASLSETRSMVERLERELADSRAKADKAGEAPARKTSTKAPAVSQKIIDFASTVNSWGEDDAVEGEPVANWPAAESEKEGEELVWATQMDGIETPAEDDPIVVSYMRFLNSRGKVESKRDEATGNG